MKTKNFQAVLDLAATVGWGYEVRWQECDCAPSPDWWIYITRPGKEDYGTFRSWEPGDERNTEQAARLMSDWIKDELLRALGINSGIDLMHALAKGPVVLIPDRPSKFVFRR